MTLDNLKVLDLSHDISGPYCARLLAGWGADVVKVERPGHGDSARNAGPFPDAGPHPETSALFLYLNTGKKSITLNLHSVTGTRMLKELVKDADVLVENDKPGVMCGLGLDYATLAKINPRLVMTSITAFGQNGTYRDYTGDGIICYAMGGQMWVCGQPDRAPLNSAIAIPEYFGGLYGYVGTMLALQYAHQTGKGQHVDVSILECLAASHQFTLTWPAYSDSLLVRPGWPGFRAPASFYVCRDGYVNLRLQGVEMPFLAYLLDMPELPDDPRFQTLEERTQNIKTLEEIVAGKLAGMSKKDVFHTAGEWRALCGYVATPEDLLTDPQYLAREFWADIDHPVAGKQTYPGAPVKMTETEWRNRRAPLLGEHNLEIYCGRLGYTKDDLVRLRASGII